MMYFPVLAAVAVLLIVTAARDGPRAALAWCWAAGLILPTWMIYRLGAVQVNLRTATGLLLLACLAFHTGGISRYRLLLADLLIVAFVAVRIVTLVSSEGLRPSIPVVQSLTWLLPYGLGRLALQDAEDRKNLTRATALVCLVLGLWAVGEAVTRINPLLAVSQHGSWYVDHDFRCGLKRAEGPTVHPIFFGMMLVLLLPWALEASRRGRRGEGPWWWRTLPWLTCAGVLATMSRGPGIAMAICLAITVFAGRPKRRTVLFVAMTAACVLLFASRHAVMEAMHALGNETGETKYYLIVNGEPRPYTGTNYRLLLFEVYRDAMWNAGWLGYGRVGGDHHLPIEGHLEGLFSSVDNQYIFTILTSGYLGLSLYVLFQLAVFAYLAKLVRCPSRDEDLWLSGSMLGALVATALMMLTVWFSRDYGYVWLFTAGMAASWYTMPQTEVSRPLVVQVSRRRLVPGHPA